jgi:tRNA-splicing ligase RtcB
MKALVLNGGEIMALGFPAGRVVGTIIRVMSENYTTEQKEYVINLLRVIMRYPEKFKNHETYGEIVFELVNEHREKLTRGSKAPALDNTIVCGAPGKSIR